MVSKNKNFVGLVIFAVFLTLMIFFNSLDTGGLGKILAMPSLIKGHPIENKREEKTSNIKINNFSVTLDVGEDLKVKTVENLTVKPQELLHGIFRVVPSYLVYTNKDGLKRSRKSLIKDISVLDEHFMVREVGKEKTEIKIGEADKLLDIGKPKDYTIKYIYDMGKDPNKGFDEFQFVFFGDFWYTTFNQASLKINMPKDFKKENVRFYYDKFRKQDVTNDIDFEKVGNSIIVKNINTSSFTQKYGLIKKSLIVSIVLPDNYFKNASNNYGYLSLSLLIIILIIMVSIIIMWKKYGKDLPDEIESVEFYPPKDFDAAMTGYTYNNKFKKEYVYSTIVELAAMKILKIEEEKKKIYLTRLKDYDKLKLSENQKTVMSVLNLEKDKKTSLASLTDFYTVFDKIYVSLDKDVNQKINDQQSHKSFIICIFLTILSYVLFRISYFQIHDLNPSYFNFYRLSYLSIFVSFIFTCYMKRRTKYGEEMLAKITGFRNFLLTAQKDRLEELVEDNPNYFYDILPFTYALGVSKKWIDKFEKLDIKMPENEYIPSLYIFDNFNSNITYPISTSSSSGGGCSSCGGGCASCGGGGGW